MKNIIFLFLITLTFLSCSTLKQKDNCETILENEPYFSQNGITKELIEKDYEILEKCGNLDSIDKVIFSAPVLGTLMIGLIPENDKITYKLILEKINEIKNSENFLEQKKLVYLSEKIKKKIVSKSEWENDKVTLKKIGMNGKHLNNFKIFISQFENTNTTYETALLKFNQSIKIKQTKIEYEEPSEFKEFDNYEKVLESAKSENKQVILYFTGYAAVNCRKMEENILNDKRIKSIINEKYLSYALFVDSRKSLSENYISKRTGKEVKTVGNKLSELQIEKFNSNRQPHFVIIDKNGNIIKEQEYTKSAEEFIEFLTLEK